MTDPIPRIKTLADQCVLCGLCLPHCPTYAFDRLEGESPRGRIALAKALASGRLDPREPDHWHGLDHCLGCRRCEAVCPAGVRYGELLVEARRLQRAHRAPAWRQRLLEQIAVHPRLMSMSLGAAGRLRPLLPKRIGRRLPRRTAATPVVGFHPATGVTRRGTVGLFLGCIARRADLTVHRAAVQVLTRLGWDVQIPARQTCCGALHRHAGDAADERTLAAANRDAFGGMQFDAILVSASGCFDSLASSFDGDQPAQVRELLEFVAAALGDNELPLRPLPHRVALHVPCTQGSVVRAGTAAATVLGRIPGLQIVPVAGHGCCGAAGSHMLLQPERAAAIAAPLLAEIVDSGAELVASGNFGCRLHLQAGLVDNDTAVRVLHPIELLSEALA